MTSPDRSTRAFLALAAIKGVGFETLRSMAAAGVDFTALFEAAGEEAILSTLRRHGARIPTDITTPWATVREHAALSADQTFEKLDRLGVILVFRSDPKFPQQMSGLKEPPYWLFVQGNLDVLAAPSVGVVGTRTPTSDGIWLANYVGNNLSDWGAPTVSGLAHGIDQEIHSASLRAGVPTIAFLGTGIFSDYPKNAQRMRAAIVNNGGAIVTEYLVNESYSARNFVFRNRLQAALCRVLIPVEWNAKSGTAHTVRFAAALRRPIALARLPHHRQLDWVPQDLNNKWTGFTLPRQQREFSAFVSSALVTNINTQLPLFRTQ